MNHGFVTVDRILAKAHRELNEADIDEGDAIEWIGEALDFLAVKQVREEAVAFLEVRNHEVLIPKNFQMIIQMALLVGDINVDECSSLKSKATTDYPDIPRPDITVIKDDCGPQECYKPYFNMTIPYKTWSTAPQFVDNFIPIRLATHSFYGSLVCKPNGIYEQTKNCSEEYSIVGSTEMKLRFSFKDGIVAMSYLRSAVDEETGYPLIPDVVQYITAISYYLRWKVAEHFSWNRREGFDSLSDKAEAHWLKYAKQAKNFMLMPKSVDELQNLQEQGFDVVPDANKYYGYFGKLNSKQNLRYR